MAEQVATLNGSINLAKSSPQIMPLGVKMVIANITGPSSYTTGGEDTLAASDFGLNELLGLVTLAGDGQYEVQYDKTNGKISWYVNAVEVANTTDLDEVDVDVLVFGL